ncbi:unnamed protein product, partial [Ixodes hexagonus]
VHATDRDTGSNARVQYSLESAALSTFHIDPVEGTVDLRVPLDHETQPLYHLVVTATDAGSPSALSSTAHVWIAVVDMNDNAPAFPQLSYSCAVSELAPRGQFVTRVAASDPDESDRDRLAYAIVGGNEAQAFAIDRRTGIVTLSNLHQFPQQPAYLLNVSVTDGVYLSHAKVKVAVLASNRHSPAFTHNVYEAALPENQPAGFLVATVTAMDADRGHFGQVSYAIRSDDCTSYFRIDDATGEIFTSQPLDRESKHKYMIPVCATDGGGRLAFTVVRVTVTDVNDNEPQFAVSEYRVNIQANTTVGTTILKASRLHADQGMAAALQYSIHDSGSLSNVTFLFNVTHDSGEVYLRAPLDGKENNAYQFFIRVRDHGLPKPLENIVPVTVVVMHPGELGPRVDLATSDYFLRESDPIGTVVLTLNTSQPHQNHGDPASHQLTYAFVPAPPGSDHELDASAFSLDERGRMILVSELDRERQATYYLTVRVETELSLVATVDVTVSVMDENDNAPAFDSASYRSSVAENVEEGCVVAKLTAHDADVGGLQKITYEFYEGNDPAADIFRVDAITGTVTTLVALDREAVPSYNFTVSARDDGLPARSATTWVFVEVVDVNDNAPSFARPRYDAAIFEDAVPGTVIVTLETSDPDSDASGVDLYIASGDPDERFGIRNTGEMFVNRPLDRETTSSYFLEVVATDGVFVATTQLAVDVLDSNDNPPICLKSKYTELVSESIAVNTYILTVEATDADENRNAQLRYYLSGKGSDDFSINSTTGNRLLDRERQPRFRLTAHVQDWGQWDWECTSAVEILLSDVNDNAPTFSQDEYTVSVAEDVDVGTLVAKVHATDKDLGFNRRVTYSFVDSARGHFSIDETSGIIQLNRPLDREDRATYNLTVQASDQGTPQLSSLATLVVVVQDVNDNPPEFSRKFYYASVSEASAVGVEVLKVLATSKDSGVNAEVTYFFSAGNELGHFSIDAKTGSVKVAKPLDYEGVRDYFLTILARDGGLPALSSQASLNISVTDHNDCPPVFGLTVYNAVVREDARVGDRIIQATSDADSAANAALQYVIVRGDRHAQFAIDKESGYISVAASLDREMISNYVLEVECSDSGVPPLSSKVLVNIEASDVNDNPPQFAQSNYSAIVQEGKPVGFTILKFTISDPDSSPNSAPFALKIISGNEDGSFRLVQQDSTLRTAAKLNPKLKSEYELVIRVSDSGTPPLFSDCRVFIKAIEESQYPPNALPMSVSVTSYLDDFPGGVLGRIRATDEDPYDQLVFDLVSSHQHLFSVDREDGTLIALPGLDVGTYAVNVSVSDGKFTTYVGVSVEVVLISEEGLLNAVGVTLENVTPEDFLLTYKKGFLKGLRSLLNVRVKEIQVISIQPSAEEGSGIQPAQKSRRSATQDLDVLFAVRKGAHGYYSAKFLKTRLKENLPLVEAASGLRIVQVAEDRCTSTHCVHGECLDHMALDRTFAVSVTTDQFSFVSPQHSRRLDCQCKPGFGGPKCEMAVNECSRKPCPAERLCVPDSSSLGYSCQCPEGKTGPSCGLVITCQEPDCYEEKHPMSFGGKSYAHYSLVAPMDRRLTLALMLRTVQATGNIMYSAGARDYSILEAGLLIFSIGCLRAKDKMVGCVQYRFDCGSGEGVVRVEQARVSDGAWHEVQLERRGNFARLSVDRRHEASGAAPGVHDVLNLDGNDLFLGAEVRLTGFDDLRYDDVRMGLVGCLDDVRVDGRLLPLHVSGGGAVAQLRRFANVQFACKTLFNPGVCGSQPCLNGGSCVPGGEPRVREYSCSCLPRFEGPNCELDTNPCASAPCLNGGTCRNDHSGGFVCNCPQRLSGRRCDYGRHCNPNPCLNGGVCEEGARSHVCRCRGFQGARCEQDVDECVHVPCASGATCLNLPGSFQCVCPVNATGPLCSDRHRSSMVGSLLPTPLLEMVVVASGLVLLFVLGTLVACCWKRRRKQRPPGGRHCSGAFGHHGGHPLEAGVGSEMTQSALATPPLPPRPASYTPSMQQDTALNNFDTVRSYGSAADDLESRFQPNQLRANNQDQLRANLRGAHQCAPQTLCNSASDTASLHKAAWDADKERIYLDKIPNGGLPPSAFERPVRTVARYTWDYSDLTTEQKPLANITEVPGNEIQDSLSLRSGDSNSHNSQIDLLPSLKGSDAVESDYISEDDEEAAQSGSPHRYERHPNQYLPSHCLSNDQSPADDLSDDGVVSYGFPSQGGRGFLVEGAVPPSSHLSCSDLSVNNVCDIEDSDEDDDDTDNTVVRK